MRDSDFIGLLELMTDKLEVDTTQLQTDATCLGLLLRRLEMDLNTDLDLGVYVKLQTDELELTRTEVF